MSKDIQPFSFHGAQLRTVIIAGEPWFVVADLAAVLEYRDAPAASRILDDDEKGTHSVSTPGGKQRLSICNESGMYSLILRSRKAEAKAFKKYVTSEVLPSIRQTGSYAVDYSTARHAVKSTNKAEMQMLQEIRREIGKATAAHHYMTENKLINSMLTGKFEGIDRDTLSKDELDLLAHLEIKNTILLGRNLPYADRKTMLQQYAMDWRMAHTPQLATKPTPEKV